MTYPEGIITRPVEAGSALAVTDGRALTVETVTVASRALIHLTTGTRLEKVTSAKASPLKGESLYWVTACTDRSGEYLDADTREIIILGEDEHTHTYTTTLRVFDEDGDVLGTYEIGPYPVPTPEAPFAYLDLDSLQVVDVTTGTAIPIPESWTQIVADAEQAAADAQEAAAAVEPALTDIADLKTKTTTGYLAPAKVAPLVSGKLPEANVPDRLTEPALSATIDDRVAQSGGASFGILGPRNAYLGDSITQGDASLWLDRIPSLISAKAAGRMQIVRNAGVGGDTTSGMLARFDADITPYKPDVVTFRGGTNDLTGLAVDGSGLFNPAQVAARLELFKNNVTAIVAKIRGIRATPVILPVPPSSGNTNPDRQAFIFQQNAWLRTFCAQQRIVFVDDFRVLANPNTGQYITGYTDDGVHPNALGCKVSSSYVVEQLAPLMSPSVNVRPVGNADPFNLIPNGLLMDWASGLPTGYTKVGGTGTIEEATDSRFRGKVAKITPASETSSTIYRTSSVAVTPGHVMAVSVAMLVKDGSRASFSAEFRSSGGTSLKTVGFTRLEGLDDNKRAEFYTEMVVPAGAATVRVTIGGHTAGGYTLLGEIGVMNLTTMAAVGITPYTPPPEIPEQVVGLTSPTQTDTSITLNWVESARAVSYTVERKPHSGSTWTAVTGVAAPPYALTGLTAGTEYDTRVTAVNATGPAAPSTVLTVSTSTVAPPSDPTLVEAVGVTPYFAFGLRKLRSAYSGPALRVRRGSDNTEADIGFFGTDLDTATLLAFANGGMAYVVTMYDQSGNGHHATQATTAKQPAIVDTGAMLAGMRFDSAGRFLSYAPGLYAAGAATVCAVMSSPVAPSGRILAEANSGDNNTQYAPMLAAAGTFSSFIRTAEASVRLNNLTTPTTHFGSPAVYSTVDSGTNVENLVNGVQTASRAYSRQATLSPNTGAIGAVTRNGTTDTFFQATGGALISEVVAWGAALNGTQRGAAEANQTAFYM